MVTSLMLMNKNIKERLVVIEERNRRVEDDKAWEVSVTRRVLVALLTFVLIGFYFTWLKVNRPWLHAIVPTTGFLLSTLVINKVKEIWLRKRRQ